MGNPQIHSFLKKNIFCPSQKHKILGLIITLYIFLSRVEEGWITTVTAEFQRSSFTPPSYRHLTKNPQLLREWREISREQCSLPKTQSSKLTFLKSCLEKKKKKENKKLLMISVLFPLGPCLLIIKNNNKINSLCSIEGSLRREIKEWEEMKADRLYHLWSQSQRSQINLDWWGSA